MPKETWDVERISFAIAAFPFFSLSGVFWTLMGLSDILGLFGRYVEDREIFGLSVGATGVRVFYGALLALGICSIVAMFTLFTFKPWARKLLLLVSFISVLLWGIGAAKPVYYGIRWLIRPGFISFEQYEANGFLTAPLVIPALLWNLSILVYLLLSRGRLLFRSGKATPAGVKSDNG